MFSEAFTMHTTATWLEIFVRLLNYFHNNDNKIIHFELVPRMSNVRLTYHRNEKLHFLNVYEFIPLHSWHDLEKGHSLLYIYIHIHTHTHTHTFIHSLFQPFTPPLVSDIADIICINYSSAKFLLDAIYLELKKKQKVYRCKQKRWHGHIYVYMFFFSIIKLFNELEK